MASQSVSNKEPEQVDNSLSAVTVKPMTRSVYGAFSLCGTEFAISASAIQEAVNEFDDYIKVPLAPDYLIGLFNLRGMIVPLVDLQKIFALKEARSTPSDSLTQSQRIIAIIQYGAFSVGLLFDTTGDVFDEKSVDRINFSHSAEGLQTSIVQGAFKLDNGNRIIQIIDPYQVINLKHLPQSDDTALMQAHKKRGKRNQCISFEVGDNLCAFSIQAIREILTIGQIDNQLLAGDNCLGAVNVRGNIIPIVDFSALLGGQPSVIDQSANTPHTVIVMGREQGMFGLLVKAVSSIVFYYDEEMVPFPVIGDYKVKMFDGCITQPGKASIILLNHQAVLGNTDIQQIAQGHHNLYQQQSVKAKVGELGQKQTYLFFTIAHQYAIDISQVNEIIELPKHLIVPPTLPKHLVGMHNLRGTMIAVIDARGLFMLGGIELSGRPKVLVFKQGESSYGLIVDSIDSILTLTGDYSLPIPKCSKEDRGNALALGAKDILQMDSDKKVQPGEPVAEKKTVLVLDFELVILKLNAVQAADVLVQA